MISPPKSVKIGPYHFEIVCSDSPPPGSHSRDNDTRLGYFDLENQTIWLRRTQGPDSLADSLLHEVLHGVLAVTNIRSRNEEDYVLRISSILLGVLRDNPELVDCLTTVEADLT